MIRPTKHEQRVASLILRGLSFTQAEVGCGGIAWGRLWQAAKLLCQTSAVESVYYGTAASTAWANGIRERNRRQRATPERLLAIKINRARKAGLLPREKAAPDV